MLVQTELTNIHFVYLCRWLKSILCEVFRWKEEKTTAFYWCYIHLFMQVKHHIRGRNMKTTKENHFLFSKHFSDNILVLGKTLYSTIQWTDWRRYKTPGKTSRTVNANTMSQGIKNTFGRKTHKPSNYLKYFEYILSTYKKNLKPRYVLSLKSSPISHIIFLSNKK